MDALDYESSGLIIASKGEGQQSIADQAAFDLGRTNSRDDRVDWGKVNELMVNWWSEKGYEFP